MNAIWQYAALSNHQAIEALKMAEYNRVRDNLKTLSASEVLASQITAASKVIRLSLEAIPDQLSANNIVEFYRSVHAPIYGATIPDTGLTASGIENGQGLEPGNNECFQVLAIQVTNGGGAPLEVSVTIGDVKFYAAAIPPNTTIGVGDLPAIFPFILSKGNALKFTVTSGTASDLVASVAYNKTVQN
jgi:hypothetical protein